jgi:hypothetical protein
MLGDGEGWVLESRGMAGFLLAAPIGSSHRFLFTLLAAFWRYAKNRR